MILNYCGLCFEVEIGALLYADFAPALVASLLRHLVPMQLCNTVAVLVTHDCHPLVLLGQFTWRINNSRQMSAAYRGDSMYSVSDRHLDMRLMSYSETDVQAK